MCLGKEVVSPAKLQIHSVITKVCRASYALHFVGIKTSMYLESMRCSSQLICCFPYYKMQTDPGSEHNRAQLHCATRTSDKAPAIFEYSMKQLQTSPHSLRAMVETHLFS